MDTAVLRPGSHQATLNGVAYHYAVQGQGSLCVAIPGGPGMHPHGYGNLLGLDDVLTVLTLHPRGAGESGAAPDGDYSLPAYARDVAALLDYLGQQQAIILGHSHGGMVAQRLAISYPDRVEKLILVDTAANLSEFLGDLDAAVGRYQAAPWFAESYAALKREWAGEWTTAAEMGEIWLQEMPFYFREWGAQYEHLRTERAFLPLRLESLQQFNTHEAPTMDLRPELGRISAPTLVAAGRYDFITTAQMAEDLARYIPGARLVIFEGSGHFPMVEEPAAWRTTIREFLAGDSGVGAR